jgi:hypothetical protein
MKFDISDFFENLSRKLKIHKILPRITWTLQEHLCTFMAVSRSVPITMRSILDTSCAVNQNTFFFRKLCRLWDSAEKCCRVGGAINDNVTRRMRFVCCITKVTTTNSEYVTPLFHSNNSYANAPQCYVIRTLPVLFSHVGCINVYDSYTKSYFLPSKHGKSICNGLHHEYWDIWRVLKKT